MTELLAAALAARKVSTLQAKKTPRSLSVQLRHDHDPATKKAIAREVQISVLVQLA